MTDARKMRSGAAKRKSPQATSGKFESFKWMRGVADDHRITQFRRFILIRLCLFRNPKSGRCDPSYDTIAKILDVDRATVIRAAEDGVRYGWLAPPRHRRRSSNLFAFTFPIGWHQPRKESQPCYFKESQPCDSLDGSHPCDPNGTPTEEPLGSSSVGKGESEQPSAADPPPPGAGGLVGPAPGEEQQGALSPSTEIRPLPPSKPDSQKESFNALRRVWARPWADADDDAAFRLYCAACVEVGHAAIEEAALAWVAAADAPRFLPSLTKWLQARGWEKPPPQKAPRRAYPPSPQRGKSSAAIAMLMAGQED